MSDFQSEPGGSPRTGRAGRSPVLARAGRDPRPQREATVAALGNYEVGPGLTIVDGVFQVAPGRDPGEHIPKKGATDSQRIAALEAFVNLLRAELAAAKLLSR